MNRRFDFDDILIVPAVLSNISSRADVNSTREGQLPIFAAPMFDVVTFDNVRQFQNAAINTIIPRSTFNIDEVESISEKYGWVAVSLEEFEYLINERYLNISTEPIKILIDVANGHMQRLYQISKIAKETYGDKLTLMVGNIANPYTYRMYDGIADYIRIGIGAGSACLTTQQTAIGFPMASLISECHDMKLDMKKPPLIVADGGMQKYSDIIKALALGADYVMLGGILNKTLESAADTFIGNKKYESWTEPGDKINQYDPIYGTMLKSGTKFYKKYRGMSTKEIQKEIKPTAKIKTSEGIIKLQQVEYTLSQWVENFNDYLRSAMSYTDSIDLESFKNAKYNFITENVLNRFKK